MKVAVIGGTGFYDLLENPEEITIETEYGEAVVFVGDYAGRRVLFMPRHGKSHNVLAPDVNYRANMMALKLVGVEKIVATAAVGSLNKGMRTGDLILIDQFVDFTTNRVKSFGKWSVNCTHPYCPDLSRQIKAAAEKAGIPMHPSGTYICLDGPRYETAAEIRLFQQWGIDVVGMTNVPEVVLARELGFCYSLISQVVNMGAGMDEIEPDLATHKKVFKENIAKVKKVLEVLLPELEETKDCKCEEYYLKALSARNKQPIMPKYDLLS